MKKILLLSLKGFLILYPACSILSKATARNYNGTRQVQGTTKDKLKNVLLKLQDQYKTTILFEDKLVAGYYVNTTAINTNDGIEGNLAVILKPFNLQFKKTGNNSFIIIAADKKEDKTIHNTVVSDRTNDTITTADKKVEGKITDEAGTALPGVSVLLKGTNLRTVTNETGTFVLSVPEGVVSNTLEISCVGFENREIRFSGEQLMKISLVNKIKQLEEVVVVGYGTQKKKDLTGAVASINTKELNSLPVPDIGQAMEGRAAGVQVITPGIPGSNVTFRIRGVGTINNSDALVVIDGFPSDAPLNTINNDDIESIQVLKDASAAAIYGARGANGVILITTKRGTSGQNHLSVNYFNAWQSPTHLVKMLNATQFASLHNEMMKNNGQPTNPAYANPSSFGNGTNWLGTLFRTAPMQNLSVSYSGGTAKSNYYVSGNVLNQDGIVINTGYKRYTVQINTNSKVFDWLQFGNNLTLTHDIKSGGDYNIRNAMAALPVQPITNRDGTYSGPIGQSSWYGDIINPIGRAKLVENTTKGYNILGSVFGEAAITRFLKFKTNAGIQANFWDDRNWSPKYNWQPIPQPNSYLFQQSNKNVTFLLDNYLTFDKSFSGVHHVTIVAGISAQNNRYDFISGSIQNFASDLTQQLNNGSAQTTLTGNASEWALLSYIGRINYAYNDKYLLTATVRRDGSSRFGANNRWGTFPSASFAWRISKEKFFSHVSFVDDLKLRAGFGITGNQNIGNYSFASVLQTALYNFNGQNVTAVVPQAIPNPNIMWESVEQSNIGIDAQLWKRINITVDAYLKNTTNMLVPMPVPISTGYSDIYVPYINAGKVQNKGIELTVTSQNLSGPVGWTTSFNLSYNQNKIISLNDTIPLITGSIGLNDNLAINRAGYPVNEFYGFVTQGIFQTQKEVDNHAAQVPGADPFNRTSPGDIRFKDMNSDGKIDDNDRSYTGNPNPSFLFALNNTFTYKGFDLGIFIQGIYGNKIFNANRIYQEGMAVAQNQTTATLQRWTGPGTSNSIPRAIFNDPNKNTRPSDRYVEDGSYLRIKNITLGYTFPKRLFNHTGITSARLYISGQNLYTFTNYTGFDPEGAASGIDYSLYPVTRTVSFGINLNL